MRRYLRYQAYLYGHGREVPHVDDDGPACHHPQQVTDHVVFAAVPESISEPRVILTRTQKNENELSELSKRQQPAFSIILFYFFNARCI